MMIILGLMVAVILTVMLLPVILETVSSILNPLPRMIGADKRFIEIENIKTREMFEVIERS